MLRDEALQNSCSVLHWMDQNRQTGIDFGPLAALFDRKGVRNDGADANKQRIQEIQNGGDVPRGQEEECLR